MMRRFQPLTLILGSIRSHFSHRFAVAVKASQPGLHASSLESKVHFEGTTQREIAQQTGESLWTRLTPRYERPGEP